jgi:HSP20 family protein
LSFWQSPLGTTAAMLGPRRDDRDTATVAAFSSLFRGEIAMLTNTKPFDVFDRMLALSRTMDPAFGAESLPSPSGGARRAQLWLPVVDCFETANALVIEADLPGVRPENIDVSFEQGTLTLKGTRGPTIQAPEKGELRVYSAERVSGAFSRSIRLPDYVDGEKVEAEYANGVLTVTVPKAPTALPRKISVRSTEEQARQISR